ncbi:MAG TPA: MlaD family protein [Baekduia sp.]|nr:MlaD family protein [Baekduia sp.]
MSLYARRLIGLGGVALLALVLVLAIARPSNPLRPTTTYFAMFDDVQGLGSIDRDVRVAGVKIGEIGEVQRRGDDARVELRLREDHRLHRDARVHMRPHTLFEGSNFVDLSPGSPSAPVLEEGATIPRSQTSNYVTLDQALRVLRTDIRADLRRLATVGARTLRRETVAGAQLLLRRAPELTGDLAGAARALQGTHRRELAGAVRGMARTVDALERRSADLPALVRATRRTASAAAAGAGRPLDATLAALPGTLRELQGTAPAVTGVVDRARRLSAGLAPALPELAAALREGAPVVRRTVPVARDATPLVRDARLIASRLAAARPALVEMFRLIDPSLDRFADLLTVFNKPSELGAPTGVSQLVGGAFAGLNAAFRPFQTPAQNPGAPGYQGRIGTRVEPTASAGLAEALGLAVPGPRARGAAPDCRDVRRVSARSAAQLRAIGGCD